MTRRRPFSQKEIFMKRCTATWKQTITVQAVDPFRLTTNIVDSTPSAVRVTVTVLHNDQKVCDLSWYTLDGTP